MNTVELPIAAQQEQDEETALVMEALKMVHGQTMMRPTMAHLIALHNSHVKTNRELLEYVTTLCDQADSARRYLHMAATYFKRHETTAEAINRFLELSKATVKKAREAAGKKGAA